jgi:hypothetical protein
MAVPCSSTGSPASKTHRPFEQWPALQAISEARRLIPYAHVSFDVSLKHTHEYSSSTALCPPPTRYPLPCPGDFCNGAPPAFIADSFRGLRRNRKCGLFVLYLPSLPCNAKAIVSIACFLFISPAYRASRRVCLHLVPWPRAFLLCIRSADKVRGTGLTISATLHCQQPFTAASICACPPVPRLPAHFCRLNTHLRNGRRCKQYRKRED